MSDYPAPPRRVVLALADLRGLTILERARAAAVAGVGERDIAPLMKAVTSRETEPAMLEAGTLLFYAIVWQLERRRDPELAWDEVQRWDLALDLDSAPDPIAEAEAEASVEAAIATGLPPAEAGELTMAQLAAYAEVRRRERRASRRGKRAHR